MGFWNVSLTHLSVRKSNLRRRVKVCAIEMLSMSKPRLCFQCPVQPGEMVKHRFTLHVPSVQSHLQGCAPYDTSDVSGTPAVRELLPARGTGLPEAKRGWKGEEWQCLRSSAEYSTSKKR